MFATRPAVAHISIFRLSCAPPGYGSGTTNRMESASHNDLAGGDGEEQPDFELTLPARAENVAVVRHAFGGLGDALDVPDHALADVKLAVTEACTNVVVHAYPEGEGPMAVSAGLANGALTVVVVDEGRGILPRPDSPGLGLG